MKKRLQGLVSMWLAVLMVVGMLPATALAESDTISIYVFNSDARTYSEVVANELLTELDTVEKSVELDTPLNAQACLSAYTTAADFLGWRLWSISTAYNRTAGQKFLSPDATLRSLVGAPGEVYLLEPFYGRAGITTEMLDLGDSLHKYLSRGTMFNLEFDKTIMEQPVVASTLTSILPKAGYVHTGWRVWTYGSGLVWNDSSFGSPAVLGVDGSVTKSLYLSLMTGYQYPKIDYHDACVVLEPYMQAKFRITQPTTADPAAPSYYTVGAEYADDLVSWQTDDTATYQWYLKEYDSYRGDYIYTIQTGQTGKTLTNGVKGSSYLCEVTFPRYGSEAKLRSNALVYDRDPITGSVVITGTPAVGETLTAVYTPGDGAETYSYQWYRGDEMISGATGSTYTLTGDDYGKVVKVVVTGTGAYGNSVEASTAQVGKGTQNAPAALTVQRKTENSVTLTPLPDNGTGSVAEYSCDGGNTWQSSNVFAGLQAGAEYTFVARYGATAHYEGSSPSQSLKVRTEFYVYYPVRHICTSVCSICGACTNYACAEAACGGKCDLRNMNFIDVLPNQWYTDAVEYVYHLGLMDGVGNRLFDINGATTRAMIVTILWRMEGQPVVSDPMEFTDVSLGDWYSEAVRWAASEGIVLGCGEDMFAPMSSITREQFAAILWRYAKYKGYDVAVDESGNILAYEDTFAISEYAVSAMEWACGASLMQGDSGYLLPNADTTRAQVVVLLKRFCENVKM